MSTPSSSSMFNVPPPSPIPLAQNDPCFENEPKSTNYIWTNQSKIKTKMDEYEYKIMSLNIRSLNKNYLELEEQVDKYKPDFVCLSEIWSPFSPNESLKGYHPIVAKKRPHPLIGGGVAIFASEKISYKTINKVNELNLKVIEIVAIEATLRDNEKIHIYSLYRPPKSKFSDTLEDLDLILENVTGKKVVIAGDVNIDTSKSNVVKDKYIRKLMSFNLLQHVQAFTRITKDSSTTIDHSISNINVIETIVIHEAITDHQTVFSLFKSKKTKAKDSNEQNESKRIHQLKTIENFQKIDWKNWIDSTKNLDIDTMYNSFHDIVQESLVFEPKQPRKFVPLQEWMTKTILQQKFLLEKARKKFIKKRSFDNEIAYKKLKKEYKLSIKKAKNDFYLKKLKNCYKNPKMTWDIINDVLKRKSKIDSHNSISYENKEITDSKEISNIMSEYYKHAAVNKIKELNSKMDFAQFLNPNEKRINKFKLEEVSRELTWTLLKSIPAKSSSGFDNVPSKLMNNSANFLAAPLTSIINKSFKEGKFPSMLKMSKINPVDKRKGSKCPANFRPIAMLSCFSKLIEKASIKQLVKYMESEIPNDMQFAYKRLNSCTYPIILLRHLIEQELQKGKFVCVTQLDLSLAFDCLECSIILPGKMKHYGFCPTTIEFFNSFFQNRHHYCN